MASLLGDIQNENAGTSRPSGDPQMEKWLPLFRHLLVSPAANAAAFSSSPSSGDRPSAPPPAAALLRLLLSPAPTLPASASDPTAAILFQTLPPFLQSQALSFLASSADFLDPHLLRTLAARVLSAPPGRRGLWARSGARHLIDGLPEEEGVPGVATDEFIDGFHDPPTWLKEAAVRAHPALPWLPVDCRSLMGSACGTRAGLGGGDGSDGIGLENLVLVQDEDVEMLEAPGPVLPPQAPPLEDSIVQRALAMQKEIVTVESVLAAQRVAKDLQDLCVKSRNAAEVLSLVRPWEADDDTLRVLLSNLVLEGDGVDGKGPALVLCSVFLPQLLELQRPPSSVLLSTALGLCKCHPAASVEAVLFPLVLRKGGLNVPQCDVLTRIIKECMHPLHVTAFCHRLLSGEEQERKPVCMPQHQESIGTNMVWTESLFTLFYNILSQDICLTPSTVGELIYVIDDQASKFPRSLKFGNFLKCFVSKCWHECKHQRGLLERAADRTDTFLTKAVLAKLRPAS